jgi:hypothetical protein
MRTDAINNQLFSRNVSLGDEIDVTLVSNLRGT